MSVLSPVTPHVPLSITQLFTVGIGPSSSHTVGPMRAAASFAELALAQGFLSRVSCQLFGSLAFTGLGHATDTAVLLGLSGWLPETVDPDEIPALIANIRRENMLMLGGTRPLAFTEASDLAFMRGKFLPGHANAMTFTADYPDGTRFERTYYSIGGGAIRTDDAADNRPNIIVPFPFSSASELLEMGQASGLSIAGIVLANEDEWSSRAQAIGFIDIVRDAMLACIDRGCKQEGILPGGLNVPRRAKSLHQTLLARAHLADPSIIFEWVSLYALSVTRRMPPAAASSPRRPMALRAYCLPSSNITRPSLPTLRSKGAARCC